MLLDKWLAQRFEFAFMCAVNGWTHPPKSKCDDHGAYEAGFKAGREFTQEVEALARKKADEWLSKGGRP